VPARYRSFFWPAVLILAGVIALLVNTNVIPADRLYLLVDLWPVILIVIGLEIIVRRTTQGGTAELAGALIVVLAIAGAATYVALSPNPSSIQTHDWSASAGKIAKASVEIDAGDATVTMSGNSDLGGDLYRAHIEYSGGSHPQVELDRSSGALTISQSNKFFLQSQKFAVTLQLDTEVSWSIQINSGSTTDTLNLSSLHIRSLNLNTGSSHDEITLGPPLGIVPVQINGGELTVLVHRPTQTRFSVDVSGGEVSLDADGHHFGAVGKVGYHTGDLGSDAYRIQVNGGSCTVTVDTATSSD